MKQTMLTSLISYIGLCIKGIISFPKSRLGQKAHTKDADLRVFKHIEKKQETGLPESPVYLHVKFEVKKLNVMQTKLIPVLSYPFFAGFPGFVSKMFCVQTEENALHGLYEWESRQAAEKYIGSYAMRFMQSNALRGSVEHTIDSQKDYRLENA